MSESSVGNYLHQLGYVFQCFVSHELNEVNMFSRFPPVCSNLKETIFVWREGDIIRKRLVSNNMKGKRFWEKRGEPPQTTPKTGLWLIEVLLSILWNWKAAVFYMLPPTDKVIYSDVYCDRTVKLNAAIYQKRPAFANLLTVQTLSFITRMPRHIFLLKQLQVAGV